MQSTNYRYLKSGENVLPSDEIRLGDKWVEAGGSCLLRKNTEVSELAEREMWYRRRLPHSGNVQFLMCISITVPVIVNCDGKTQEEIEGEAGQLAVEKILSNPREYIHFENIDWANCKIDDIQPEPKIPGKKALDYCNAQHNQGLGIAWRISDTGHSKLQVQREDEPEHNGVELTPLESDETAWEIAKSLGWKLDENGYVLAYPGDEPKGPGKYRYLEWAKQLWLATK